MEPVRFSDFFLLLSALALPLSAAAAPNGAPTVVLGCVIDGRSVYGDTLPPECVGKEWFKKINGVTVFTAKLPPKKEEIELRAKIELCKKKHMAEITAKENWRIALYERYSSVSDIDAQRNNEVERIDGFIADLRAREQDLIARRARYDDDVKALEDKGKSITPGLATAIGYADVELARQRADIAKQIEERDKRNKYYDETRRAYLEDTAPMAPVDLDSLCTREVTQSARGGGGNANE
ncbi:MAG: hypothetical protein LBF50_07640 [Azoarcus sp.]|jgi:hypothetical protein|nr:hypothetical protein [Azoarcus sp.]